jgi:hypothetical protein
MIHSAVVCTFWKLNKNVVSVVKVIHIPDYFYKLNSLVLSVFTFYRALMCPVVRWNPKDVCKGQAKYLWCKVNRVRF